MRRLGTFVLIGLFLGVATFVGCGGTNPPPTNNNGTPPVNNNDNDNGGGNDNTTVPDPNQQVCDDINRCCAGDGFCDSAECTAEDADCAMCGADGECIIDCPNGVDSDCSNEEICERNLFCCEGDGNCDVEQCPTGDGDCDLCAAEGTCVVGCDSPDPDCTNEDVCAAIEFCCADDDLCDTDECPETDSDCDGCGANGTCIALCPTIDPDCTSNDQICDTAGFCCPNDPFCDEEECPQPDPDCN